MESLRGFITVFHFEQHHADSGSGTLVVTVKFTHHGVRSQNDTTVTPHLQIFLGTSPLPTTAVGVPDTSAAGSSTIALDAQNEETAKLLRLLADVPQSTETAASHNKLSIQAILDGTTIDSIDFGYYTRPTTVKPSASPKASDTATAVVPGGSRVPKRERELEAPQPSTDMGDARSKLRKHTPSDESQDEAASCASDGSGIMRRLASPPSPMDSEFSDDQTTLRPTSKKPDQIIRTSQIPQTTGHAERSKIRLRLNHDLDEAVSGWTTEEDEERRRLIQFWRRQKGPDIQLCYKPIRADRFMEGTNVVSCIFREETNEHYITSVDLIGLLESLIGNRFSTEEKNRVRRNLEGFKPETMSKSKADEDSQAFFTLIMGFGEPRPRNIEKDLKVFKWKIVHQAMLKILSKYSYVRSQGLADGVQGKHESFSSEDELDHRPARSVKMEENHYSQPGRGMGRALRSGWAHRSSQSKDQPSSPSTQSSQGTGAPKTEQASPPPEAPGSRMPRTSANRSRNVQHRRNAVPNILEAPNASGRQSTSALSATGAVADLYGSQLVHPTIAPASPSPIGALDGAPVMDDVNEFLYDTTAYMRDVDEVATQGTNSPPSFDDTSGELDGINGRSFQHPMQRKMQRDRLEADMGAQRPHPEAPPTCQFLGQQNHIQPQPEHPPLLHLLQQQHPQMHVPQVLFPHHEPATQPPRSESSLAHALDESRIQRTTPSSSSRQQQPHWEHPLAYPQLNTSSQETLSAHTRAYDDSSIPSPAGLSAQADSVSSVKAEHWDDDPNAYLIHASEEASYNTPPSYGPTHPAEWVTTLLGPTHYPYPHPQDHM